MKFKTWKRKVNNICFAHLGVEADDLPDQNWRPAYDDGLTPREAIEDLLDIDLENIDFDDLANRIL